jgi:hypothetical protein
MIVDGVPSRIRPRRVDAILEELKRMHDILAHKVESPQRAVPGPSISAQTHAHISAGSTSAGSPVAARDPAGSWPQNIASTPSS